MTAACSTTPSTRPATLNPRSATEHAPTTSNSTWTTTNAKRSEPKGSTLTTQLVTAELADFAPIGQSVFCMAGRYVQVAHGPTPPTFSIVM
jgi:hypothetical protein